MSSWYASQSHVYLFFISFWRFFPWTSLNCHKHCHMLILVNKLNLKKNTNKHYYAIFFCFLPYFWWHHKPTYTAILILYFYSLKFLCRLKYEAFIIFSLIHDFIGVKLKLSNTWKKNKQCSSYGAITKIEACRRLDNHPNALESEID